MVIGGGLRHECSNMYTTQNYNQIPLTFWMMLLVANREVSKQASTHENYWVSAPYIFAHRHTSRALTPKHHQKLIIRSHKPYRIAYESLLGQTLRPEVMQGQDNCTQVLINSCKSEVREADHCSLVEDTLKYISREPFTGPWKGVPKCVHAKYYSWTTGYESSQRTTVIASSQPLIRSTAVICG